MGALDAVRRWQLDRFWDHMPPAGLPRGIPLWSSQPVEIGLVRQHRPEVRMVIESRQRELQLVRQRLRQRRLASTACPYDKDLLISLALPRAFFRWISCRTNKR